MNKTLDRKKNKDWWQGFDSDLWNMGIDPEERKMATYDNTVAQMKYVNEASTLRNIKSIDFDLSKPGHARNKIIENLPAWIDTIVHKINPDDKWIVFYQYENRWRSRKLDEVTCELLKDQAYRDINPGRKKMEVNDVQYVAHDYDFMPVQISLCQSIRIVNIGNYNTKIEPSGKIESVEYPKSRGRLEDDETYKAAVASGNAMLIQMAKMAFKGKIQVTPPKPVKTARLKMPKEGAFWKWLCTIPINLERYMIFNTLDDRTAKLMEEDNCLIYACKQFGLKQDIIDHMKDIIQVKHFSLSKLKQISEDTGVTFLVEEKDGRKHQQGDGKGIVVPLLMYEHHYMLNERVKISPYYIKHIHEINADKKVSKWPKDKKEIIDRIRIKHGKKYYTYDQPDYPLKLILKTIFECNGFEPMKMGDYMTYASSLYKYKLDPIEDLDFNPKFCCRLKAPNGRRVSNFER